MTTEAERPEQPDITPPDQSKAGLRKWISQFEAYKTFVEAETAHLLSTHDNARELVPTLQTYFQELDPDQDPKQWKIRVVSTGTDTFTVRAGKYDRLQVHRTPQGTWLFQPPKPTTSTAETAHSLLSHLFWWGDNNAIYLAKSLASGPAYVDDDGFY